MSDRHPKTVAVRRRPISANRCCCRTYPVRRSVGKSGTARALEGAVRQLQSPLTLPGLMPSSSFVLIEDASRAGSMSRVSGLIALLALALAGCGGDQLSG